MTVNVTSNLPVGAGLGSSASYSVCLATGLLLVLGHITIPNYNEKIRDSNVSGSSSPMNLINRWAFQAERIIHGTPSGIDNAVATYGKYSIIYICTSFICNITYAEFFILFITAAPMAAGTRQLYDPTFTVASGASLLDGKKALLHSNLTLAMTTVASFRLRPFLCTTAMTFTTSNPCGNLNGHLLTTNSIF